jgi:hypothetical protein
MSNRYTLTLSDPQRLALKDEAERLGISSAELTRRIIDQWRSASPTPYAVPLKSEDIHVNGNS